MPIEYPPEPIPFPASENTVEGSLLEDLRYIKGSCDGLEWLIIYEAHWGLVQTHYTMLYAKMNILSEKGRHLAEFGREEIYKKCSFREYGDQVKFVVAISLAINRWDYAHPRKPAPHPEFDDAEEL